MRELLLFLLVLCSLATHAQYSTVNQSIPDDGSTVTFPLIISGLPSVAGSSFGLEQVCLNMTHPYDDDMEVKLQSPDGTVVLLFSHVGGDGDNFAATCLREDAATNIASGSAPFSGTYNAMGDLGLFNNGQNPNGTWLLIVHDTYAFADQGYLQGWGLAFGNNPAQAFDFTSSNLPIIKINSHGQGIPDDPKVEADFNIIDNGPGMRNYVSDTVFSYTGKILVEQQGFSGPFYPKKNYDIDLIDSAQNKVDAPLLGMPTENDWILKAEYLDISLMANPLTYEMCRRMGNYAPRTRYCEVVVDGDYVGVYSLTEKVKRDANRVNIAKLNPEDTTGAELTGGYIIEMNINGDPPAWTSQYEAINHATHNHNVEFKEVYPKQDEIAPQQHTYIKGFVDSFENSLMRNITDPHTWRKLVAEKSFIDFQIANEFSANYDSYGRSTYLYKEKITDGNKLHIGPSWDYDRAFADGTTQGWVWELTHQGWPFPFWWSKLNSDSIYQRKLWCRWTTLRMSTLSNDSFMAFIDSTHVLLAEGAARNFERWSELGVTSYDASVDRIKTFVTDRLSWMDANIMPYGATLPQIALSDTSSCSSLAFGLSDDSLLHYRWNTGDTLAYTTAINTGSYTVSVKDDYGCSATASAHVVVYLVPDAAFNGTQLSTFSFSFAPADTSHANYLWQFGDGQTSNLQTAQHLYIDTGTYTVQLTVTDTNGCTAALVNNLHISAPSTIVENVLQGLKVYPNPFHDFLQIQMQGLTESGYVLVKDVTGRVVATEKINSTTTRIATANLNAGVYFVEVKLIGGNTQTQRLVKR